jgi:hypothetical protein
MARMSVDFGAVMVARSGPLASPSCKLRQAWKGAAVAMGAGAGVWLVRAAAYPSQCVPFVGLSAPIDMRSTSANVTP